MYDCLVTKLFFRFSLSIFISFAILSATPVTPSRAETQARAQIAFTAFRNGQWDIFSISPDGENLTQLTTDSFEERDPVFSPDGTQLAFAANRNNNWDIYILDLQSGKERQLTSHPHYDGAPAFSPDGEYLAFESFRSGDLDVWLINLTTDTAPQNLTADSSAGDFVPAWGKDSDTLFFASWRAGDSDIWALNLQSGVLTQHTTESTSETHPVWNTVQSKLAYLRNHLGQTDIWVENENENHRPLTWLGSMGQSTFDPSGKSLAGVLELANGERLIRLDDASPVPKYLTPLALLRGGIDWHQNAIIFGTPIEGTLALPVYDEAVTPSTSLYGEPYDLVRLNDLQTGIPWLADRVDDSFSAMRFHLRDEVGYDFLGELSEALRPLNFFSDASQYSSWHKSGRAFDTRFDLPGQKLQIVKEEIGGDVYWRVFLRCEDQSGRCGTPATARPWDYSGNARTVLAPGQGGVEKTPLYGYYVDFTALARTYGWERIASHDDEENFSWTWHFKAFEYWHFQKPIKDGKGLSNWYQAVSEVYPPDEVSEYFTWDKMRAADESPQLVFLKGAPTPPSATRWWEQIPERQ